MPLAPSHPPLYRTIAREALSTAWHHPRLWVLALFASLLMTGGMYDVIIRSLSALGEDAALLLSGSQSSLGYGLISWATQPFQEIGTMVGFLGTLDRFQGILLSIILLGIVGASSMIAQGALVYGLGIRIRGEVPSLSACLAVGTRFFWKTAFLNAITLGLLWFFRTLVLMPFGTALEATTAWTVVGSITAYLLYIVAIIVLTSTHMLGLTSLILQKYSVHESFLRGLAQTRAHWLLILEFGAGFFLLGAALYFGLALAYVVAGVPLLVLTLSAALLDSGVAATLLNVVFFGGALLMFLAFGAFATTVQYSAWNQLALRVAQGTAVAKVHRWFPFLHRR
jgi:hypothetical protein